MGWGELLSRLPPEHAALRLIVATTDSEWFMELRGVGAISIYTDLCDNQVFAGLPYSRGGHDGPDLRTISL